MDWLWLLKDGSYDYVLSQRDGLSGSLTANSFNFIENKEKLYLCLQNGLCQLDLDSLDQSTSPKKFCVPSINIDGVDYPLDEDKPLQISSDATRITYKAYVLTNSILPYQKSGRSKRDPFRCDIHKCSCRR